MVVTIGTWDSCDMPQLSHLLFLGGALYQHCNASGSDDGVLNAGESRSNSEDALS